MVNIPLKNNRGAYKAKKSNKLLKKPKSGTKNRFPLIPFLNLYFIKGSNNIQLNKPLYLCYNFKDFFN